MSKRLSINKSDRRKAKRRFTEPNDQELEHIVMQNLRLSRTFSNWSFDSPFDLLSFAVYEGCDEPVMRIAAPYAVGHELVKSYGFRWVMLEDSGDRRVGVMHEKLDEPVDLHRLTGDESREEASRHLKTPGAIGVLSLASREVANFLERWQDWLQT